MNNRLRREGNLPVAKNLVTFQGLIVTICSVSEHCIASGALITVVFDVCFVNEAFHPP